MKKRIVIFISLIVVIMVMGVVLIFMKTDEPTTLFTDDEIRFKDEYESLNGMEYKEESLLKTINIISDNNIKYLNDENVLKYLTDGTNIVYFGWPECNWCRTIVPTLIDVANSNNIENVYYYNFKDIRVAYENNNDLVKVKLYEDIINVIGDDITSVFEEDSSRNGEKKILAPTVIFIKNGKYVGIHVKSVESHVKDSDELTTEQGDELKSIYQNYIDKIKGNSCYEQGC